MGYPTKVPVLEAVEQIVHHGFGTDIKRYALMEQLGRLYRALYAPVPPLARPQMPTENTHITLH